MKCPNCGKFVGKVFYWENEFTGQIVKVEGECKKCGKVDLTNEDWSADELIGEQ